MFGLMFVIAINELLCIRRNSIIIYLIILQFIFIIEIKFVTFSYILFIESLNHQIKTDIICMQLRELKPQFDTIIKAPKRDQTSSKMIMVWFYIIMYFWYKIQNTSLID